MRKVKLAISLFSFAFYFASCGDDSPSSSDFLTVPESNRAMFSEAITSSSSLTTGENEGASSSSVEGVSSLGAYSSSALSSSSVRSSMLSSSSVIVGLVVKNGDKKEIITKLDDDPEKNQSAGRFWLLMTRELDATETKSLEKIGIHKQRCYSGSVNGLFEKSGNPDGYYSYMYLCLMNADKDVEKITIMSLIDGMYNAFDADESVADGIIYHSRGKETLVKRVDDDTLAMQTAGRFWIIKDYSTRSSEEEKLKDAGVELVSCTRFRNDGLDMSICLAKSEKNIEKATINSIIDGLYNTFSADDTTKLEFDYESAGWDKTNGSGEIVVACWEDVTINACKEIVKTCKGENAASDFSVVLASATKETIDCLLSNKDVNSVEPVRYGELD